jgi:hypothetical protein
MQGGPSVPKLWWGFGRGQLGLFCHEARLIGLRSPTRSMRDLDPPCRKNAGRFSPAVRFSPQLKPQLSAVAERYIDSMEWDFAAPFAVFSPIADGSHEGFSRWRPRLARKLLFDSDGKGNDHD